MAKYVALQEVLSLELGTYLHPGDVFEVTVEDGFPDLVSEGVIAPIRSNQAVQYSNDGVAWFPFVPDPDKPYQVRIVNQAKVKESDNASDN